jgi:hypothetical protein
VRVTVSFECNGNALAARFPHSVRLWTILDIHVVSYRRGGGASASLIVIIDTLTLEFVTRIQIHFSSLLRSTIDRTVYRIQSSESRNYSSESIITTKIFSLSRQYTIATRRLSSEVYGCIDGKSTLHRSISLQ